MAYKILTGEEKHALLGRLQNEIKGIEDEGMRQVCSVMLALLHENIRMEREKAEANDVSAGIGVPTVKDMVHGVIAQFETSQLPSIITQQYVSEFAELSDNLAMLSKAVINLKELLVQAVASGDVYKRPDGLTFQ